MGSALNVAEITRPVQRTIYGEFISSRARTLHPWFSDKNCPKELSMKTIILIAAMLSVLASFIEAEASETQTGKFDYEQGIVLEYKVVLFDQKPFSKIEAESARSTALMGLVLL